jgi:hypothetical protein
LLLVGLICSLQANCLCRHQVDRAARLVSDFTVRRPTRETAFLGQPTLFLRPLVPRAANQRGDLTILARYLLLWTATSALEALVVGSLLLRTLRSEGVRAGLA